MRHAMLLVTLFSVGCAGLPEKPNVAVCTLDLPRSHAICFMSQGVIETVDDLSPEVLNSKLSDEPMIIPLEEMDKSFMFSPEDWGKISIYMKTLRDYAQQRCM